MEKLRPLVADDLDLVRAWRNAPRVRHASFSQHEIAAQEHRQWFAQASADAQRRQWLFERDGRPLGFASLGDVAPDSVAEWGFYTAPDAPRGTGRLLCAAVLRQAFEVERVHKVCGRTLARNDASIRLHLGLGFSREGTLRQHFHDGTRWCDVCCFGLLRGEWAATHEQESA